MIPRSALIEFQQGVSSSKYATATCISPIYRRVRLSEDGSYKDMYCDCGKCLVCTDRRRNEMASRMFLHAVYYEYCYFITLTYGSYNLLPFTRHPFLADWLQTVPTYDTHNDYHNLAWSPTILVKSHLQKFLKRLRKTVPLSFTYAACGEYGDKYGRPHFHLVLFSHCPISKDQVQNAWSLECKRTDNKLYVRPWRGDLPKTKENGYFRFNIGHIQYADLYANGSLNYDGKHPGQDNSYFGKNAMHNFSYVAKYLGKSKDALNNLPAWVYQRIRYAWCCYTDNIDELAKVSPHPEEYQLTIKNNVSLNFDNYEFKNIYLSDFEKLVSPFFVSSRGNSIGKQYYIANRRRFQAKEFALPSFMGKPITFPSYYFRLLQLDKYPIRLRKVVPSGISHTKDLLPRVYSYFTALRENGDYWFTVRGLVTLTEKNQHCHDLIKNGVYYYSLTGNPFEGEVDHVDFVTSDNSVIHFVYDPLHELFRGYIFNRHTKSYDLYEHYYDREEFCDLVLKEIDDEYKDFVTKVHNMQLQFDLQNTVLSDEDAVTAREQYIKLRLEYQIKYQALHNNKNL